MKKHCWRSKLEDGIYCEGYIFRDEIYDCGTNFYDGIRSAGSILGNGIRKKRKCKKMMLSISKQTICTPKWQNENQGGNPLNP